jgi:hypothetical protein
MKPDVVSSTRRAIGTAYQYVTVPGKNQLSFYSITRMVFHFP